ncbi:MAG TPA: hypothetical protein VK809_02240, partial [Bacteroidia bacterium]|nr:hypothetical protein [Bacteroidia bacterium]
NTISGDWQAFMSNDIAIPIATIAAYNTDDYFTYIKNLYANIKAIPSGSTLSPTDYFKAVFDFLSSLAFALNEVFTSLPVDSDFYQFLNISIGSKLATPLAYLSNYYIAVLNNDFGSYFTTATTKDPQLIIDPFLLVNNCTALLGGTWNQVTIPNPNPLSVISFSPPPAPPPVNAAACIQISSSSVFTDTINEFLNGMAFIAERTRKTYLHEIISNDPNHAPHYALYLAFLQLFKSAQEHLNEYTGRHLAFYYKDVLQLKPANGKPDDVHVAFTLQKNLPQHLLPEGTKLNAGKDSKGNSISYALTDDIVVNQASVQNLQSLLLLKNSNPTGTNIPPGGTKILLSEPVSNSSDGAGGKITNPDNSWYPFGDLNNDTFITGTPAVGFAMASNLLYLNEGGRSITIILNFNETITNIDQDSYNLNDIFSAQFTGNKNWFDAGKYPMDTDTYSVEIYQNQLTVNINISASAPPIVPYSQKIHGGNWPQNLPMVQVLLKDMNFYSVLKQYTIKSIEFDVDAFGLKNLSLQNDDGKVDPSKPFKPFGSYNDIGNGSLIIGCKEIFQKPELGLTVHFDLYFPYSNPSVGSITGASSMPGSDSSLVTVDLLADGRWQGMKNSTGNPIQLNLAAPNNSGLGYPYVSLGSADEFNTDITLNMISTSLLNTPVIKDSDYTPNTPYDANSENGFIRLTNQLDLSLTTNLANQPKPSIAPDPNNPQNYIITASAPLPSAAPTIRSITLDYSTGVMIMFDERGSAFANRQQFFYHIEPFGFREMHPYLFLALNDSDLNEPDNNMHFLPVFNLDNDKNVLDTGKANSTNNGGELWIGLTGALPGETHSILFEVSEGSSNPLKDVTNVDWYYLSNNNWISLDDHIVDDTNKFSKSGLVVFPLPGDETLNNTRAASGLVWVKAVVQKNIDAICRIISITPNAAKAELVQDIPNGIEFLGNIDAGTISKLVVPDGSIKQVSQPYPSFGGMLHETGNLFEQRVSERLRHKNRAVTAWDYERLVLQNFQQIHKVKCLNHSMLDTDTQAYSELKPGHVMIVTIPDLTLLTGADKFLPFTNKGLLEDIFKFLTPLTSPFVTLHVENPLFEGIEFEFDVSFKPDYDVNFYTGQLNTDIMNFLMPWAAGSKTSDIEFGGSIEKSAVLEFVQKQKYVDYVTCFKMNQWKYTEDGFVKYLKDVEVAVASTARSILVPYYLPGIPPLGNTIHSPADCSCNG